MTSAAVELSAHQHRAGKTGTSTWFYPVLLLTVAVGLAVRIAFVTAVSFPRIANDAVFFRMTATDLADGKGYVASFVTHPDKLVPTAAHPPLFPALLSVFDLLGIQSITAQRVGLAVVCCVAVLVVGLVGRKVAGPMVGIVAAAIAALDPIWLQYIGTLLSESIYLIVVPLMLLLALRCLKIRTSGDSAFSASPSPVPSSYEVKPSISWSYSACRFSCSLPYLGAGDAYSASRSWPVSS